MKIIGFNFTKINAKKGNFVSDKIKIRPNLNISEIKEAKTDIFKTKEQILIINFNYTIEYEESESKIEFEGNVIVALDLKKTKEILKKWKDKQIESDFKIDIFNIIMRKSNIKALQLEDDLGIPYHFQLPFIQKNQKN